MNNLKPVAKLYVIEVLRPLEMLHTVLRFNAKPGEVLSCWNSSCLPIERQIQNRFACKGAKVWFFLPVSEKDLV
ncbi:hypothetical protein [Snodgrassella alvi]|uniref:hypothetical protein n=1 Tax=Snodgrassella alvi TaxID=1196083 RepID=UPI000C1E9BA5|nr:hypothetical protein [Snodgrassella alvi]PIT42851.1 hypothetical protein BHC53_02590 [Snodgrassella alvi]